MRVAPTIEYHYHRPGRGETVYRESLALDRPDLKVTLLKQYEGRDVRSGAGLILQAGAPIVWFVFPGAWHDVGRFHLADGTFTGWYTNLCTPVRIEPGHWACTDLFLDLWQPAAGSSHEWLDEQEFREAVEGGVVDGGLAARAIAERAAIETRVEVGDWPPAAARDLDLAGARRLLARK